MRVADMMRTLHYACIHNNAAVLRAKDDSVVH